MINLDLHVGGRNQDGKRLHPIREIACRIYSDFAALSSAQQSVP